MFFVVGYVGVFCQENKIDRHEITKIKKNKKIETNGIYLTSYEIRNGTLYVLS